MQELVPISSSLWARGGVHPGQVASPSQGNTETFRTNNHAHTHSHLRAIESHDSGLWEGAGVPGKNPRIRGENMQTPCRKIPGRKLNPGTFYQCYQGSIGRRNSSQKSTYSNAREAQGMGRLEAC
ncbi:hypothetical protein ATANTOWER_020117 [Ataeniobius toweri]|uniref:Uncharacterized protein n=1 Tax=Ataeniobius toweri TaxID=208326 RepID=A0ABU7B2A9_9TELE|nr:hypothetical protein [Ataeniobius toweri]